MPIEKPRTLDLWYTRGATYTDTFGFPGRGADSASVAVTMTVKRRDALSSPALLTLAGALVRDAADPSLLKATFTATPEETAALQSGTVWYGIDLVEAGGARMRYLEGRFQGND